MLSNNSKCLDTCNNFSPILNSGALFVPPSADKVNKLAGREKIPAYFFIDPEEPNVLYISTCEKAEIANNSIYYLTIPEIEFKDGETIQLYKNEFITAPSPAYVSIEDVLSLCGGMPLNKANVAYHIKEASKMADYWAFREKDSLLNKNLKSIFDKDNIEADYYPFYMFVKYKSVVECIKEFYISAVSKPAEYHDVLSDLERKEKMDLSAIKALLDKLEDEAKDWIELVSTITADPEWALRGKYSFAVTNYNYRPYHPTGLNKADWTRGY